MKSPAVPYLLSSIFLILHTSVISCARDGETTTAPEMELETESSSSPALRRGDSDSELLNSLIPPKLDGQLLHNEHLYQLILSSSRQLEAEFGSVREMVEKLDTWEAPAEILKKYPYYFSGRDEEGRSIFVAELGRWDVRSTVQEGGEMLSAFHKYTRQIAYNVVKSFPKRESEEDEGRDFIFIADFDELSIRQVGHVPTLTAILELVKDMEPFLLKVTYEGYFINANYVTQRFLELLRPILGAVFERVEVFGTNSVKWIPHLRRRLPQDQLPSWYGGVKDFKPIAIYG